MQLAKCPLAGTAALVNLVPAPLRSRLPKHVLVLVVEPDGTCHALDFLPEDPLSPVTAAQLGMGMSVPGAPFFCSANKHVLDAGVPGTGSRMRFVPCAE